MSLLLVPAVVAAQAAPPAPPAPAPVMSPAPPAPAWTSPSPEMRADMQHMRQAMRSQMESLRRLHEATRAKMLDALSAAHRAAVARIIGDLAISPSPDPHVAARRIDAVLSAAERSAIVADSRAEMAQMRAAMAQMRAQMQAHMAQMQAHMAQMRTQMQGRARMWHSRHGHHQADAGRMLLESLTGGHGMAPPMLMMMHPRR